MIILQSGQDPPRGYTGIARREGSNRSVTIYYKNGKLHNRRGPAVIYDDHGVVKPYGDYGLYYWINGERIFTKAEFLKITRADTLALWEVLR